MSELHSDGSILRRNNVRFGIKVKSHQPDESSVGGEGMASALYNPVSLQNNNKHVINLVLTPDQLDAYKSKLVHIVTSTNHFHFLLHE